MRLEKTIRLVIFSVLACIASGVSAQMKAGVGKMEISKPGIPANDSLYVKVLILDNGGVRMAIITVDAVSLGEIGYIKNEYVGNVRKTLLKEFNIKPSNVLINASHCHGIICSDIEERTILAAREAAGKLQPVTVGAGRGSENRIMENRRVKLRNGKEADMRRAYSLPPDEQIAGIGPVDPEIGLLRINRKNGKPLAVLYNFAMHPIQSVPNGKNTADITGISSTVIENNLGDGAMALFVQGCGGDINPVVYKDVSQPRDAEPLGNLLALSALQGLKKIQTKERPAFRIINETITLPRADFQPRIDSLQRAQQTLLSSLQGSNINFKTYVPLLIKYSLSPEYPSYYSHRYLHDGQFGRNDLEFLDSVNRKDMETYKRNIYIMEEMTRNEENLRLLKMHQKASAGSKTIDVEIMGVRIGDFVLVTFPGELTVQIGLNIKKRSPHDFTFVAGYTNGYIYYAPTDDQLGNMGGAQEDSDTNLAPGWQQLFERKAQAILEKL